MQKSYDLSEYLTVKEFATRVGKSQQSIYKKMQQPSFDRYVTKINGKRMIHVSAIKDLYTRENITDENVLKTEPEETAKSFRTVNDELIEFLKRQIEEKDRQIASLSEALKAEQVLRASADHRIALLESKETQAGETIEQQVYTPDPEEQSQIEQPEIVRIGEETPGTALSFWDKLKILFRR